MILQLTHHIQEFLYRHNKPSLSFFEQMVQNQMKQEELQNLEQQKIEAEKVAHDREQDEDVVRYSFCVNEVKLFYWLKMTLVPKLANRIASFRFSMIRNRKV